MKQNPDTTDQDLQKVQQIHDDLGQRQASKQVEASRNSEASSDRFTANSNRI